MIRLFVCLKKKSRLCLKTAALFLLAPRSNPHFPVGSETRAPAQTPFPPTYTHTHTHSQQRAPKNADLLLFLGRADGCGRGHELLS